MGDLNFTGLGVEFRPEMSASSDRIQVVPDPWSSSRVKMSLLCAIGSPKRFSTNFAVFSKVCIEFLIDCKLTSFQN